MNADEMKKISKTLSYVLRHRPDSIGLELGSAGWIGVDELLAAIDRSGQCVSLQALESVVASNDKQRFEFNDDRTMIRARQGHSVDIAFDYKPVTPPSVLYHGTAERFLSSIFEKGLLKGNRHHVHMSTNRETMLAVGMRHGKPIVLSIDSESMHANGHEFFVTGNDVWLTEHVPAQYIIPIPAESRAHIWRLFGLRDWL